MIAHHVCFSKEPKHGGAELVGIQELPSYLCLGCPMLTASCTFSLQTVAELLFQIASLINLREWRSFEVSDMTEASRHH